METNKLNETIIKDIFEKHIQKKANALNFLVDLVQFFRKSHKKTDAEVSITPLLSVLKEEELYQIYFREAVETVFAGKRKIELMTDAGLISDLYFFFELRQRISYKIVPSQPLKENIQYALNQIFHSGSDIKWLNKIPIEQLLQLTDSLEENSFYHDSENQFITKEIVMAVLILSHRMGGLALQTNVRNLVPEFNDLESPFIALDRELNIICEPIVTERKTSLDSKKYELDLKQLNILASQCEDFVDRAFSNASKYGISFKVNQTLLLIRQQIQRLRELYQFLFTASEEERKKKSLHFFLNLILYNNTKNDIGKLIDDSVYNITYEITTHTSKTGEHYITSGKREYLNMLKTASFGGIIVGFLCLFKLLISKTEMSQFAYALAYSLNYGLGFVTIYLTGSTLATKQPAMTAATIAHSLENINLTDKKSKSKRYTLFSNLFARVFRSQFIAFVGNVLLAFPTALLLVYGYFYIFGYNVSESKSTKLLADLNIWETPVIFHAFIAGIFLFLSGIIAGNVANKNNYTNFYYRLSEHPFLKRIFGTEKTTKFANWMKKKWPGIVSNMWFGIFMGSTAVIGAFIGLNLDIRHITFASGNFALGLFGENYNVTWQVVFWSILGIVIIGFVNFMVSFTLSIMIALRSRNIPFGEIRNMGISILYKLRRQPLHFFFPITEKNENKEDDKSKKHI